MIVKLYGVRGEVVEVPNIARVVIADSISNPLAVYTEDNSIILGTKLGDKDFAALAKSLGLYIPKQVEIRDLKK